MSSALTWHAVLCPCRQESMPVITELEKEGRAVEIDAAQSPEQVRLSRGLQF